MGGNNEFFKIFERNKYLKNYPACKELTIKWAFDAIMAEGFAVTDKNSNS